MKSSILQRRSIQIAALFMLLAMVACDFQGCGAPGIPGGPTPRPTVDVASLPPVAPQLLEQRPYDGEELPLDGSIDLYFDQPMDQASVTSNLVIDPALEVELAWVNEATLRITPKPGQLQRDTEYTVNIGAGAKSASGLVFEQPPQVTAHTVGFLAVSEVVPADNTGGVEPNSVITVLFNRPVVPLGIAEDSGQLPQPLRFSPDIPGKGEWINTSIYQWKPESSLAGGQTYQATVTAGLIDQTGGILQEDFNWGFTTLPPEVVSISPQDAQTDVRLDSEIQVEFNQPMDRASAEAAFSLIETQTNQAVGGTFVWSDKDHLLTFKPSGLLALDGQYRATMGASAHSPGAAATPLTNEAAWGFDAVHTPAVVSTRPANGGRGPVDEGIGIAFSAPMNEKTLTAARIVSDPPLPDDATFYYSDYNHVFQINAALEPSTPYTVTLLPGAADPYGNSINEAYTFSFETKALDPLVVVRTTGLYGVYNASAPTQLFVTHRNVSRINFRLAALTVQEFARLTNPSNYDALYNFSPSEQQLVRAWSIDASQTPLNESGVELVKMTEEGSGALPAGIYLLIADAPEGLYSDIRHFLIVSNANITFKNSFDQTMIWMTNLQSGVPMPQAGVQIYDENFNRVGQGTTDADGILALDTPHRSDIWGLRYAVADSNGVFGVALSEWDEGISPWEFNQPSNFNYDDFTLYMYTDRPLYRPGQEVFFKGVLRNKKDVTYSLPSATTVHITITNDQGETISAQDAPVTAFGTFNGSVTLSDAAGLGYYGIQAQIGEVSAWQGFQVAQYRKPEFVVNIEPQAANVLAGETVNVNLDSQFYFGGPVSDAAVTWTVLADKYFYSYEGSGNYSFGDFDFDAFPYGPNYVPGFGEKIAEGEGKTDADGKMIITFPARLDKGGDGQRLTVEATVEDVNGVTVSNRTNVIVHQGQVYVGVSPDQYVGNAGRSMSATLLTVDWGGNVAPNQAVKVEFFERHWTCATEEDETGRTAYRCTVQDKPTGAPQNVTTDGDGKASASFTPPGAGSYKILATVTDAKGNTVKGSGFVWVTGSEYTTWRQANSNRIDLVADKKSYQPGDTAKILIASPFQGSDARALITVERGSILTHQVVTLASNSYVYELPITGAHAPDVFVSVVIVKGVDATNPVPGFRIGLTRLVVNPVQQTALIKVTPDKDVVGPGDDVTYTITTTDFQGKPVNAEVSLALVDKALLALSPPNSGEILDHFYGSAPIGVRTSVPMIYLVDRLNQELLDRGKGGGGGGAEGFFDIRSEFKDTAYWSANVTTGEQGSAQVKVTLPDNLTTWQMDARAVTKDTLVGQTEMDITATRPLLIRPETPRFFVVDDQATVSAVVNNNTANDIEATVKLEATGVAINGSPTQKALIKAGGRANVDWPVVVESNAQWVDLTFSVEGGGLQDASKPTLGDPAHDQMLPVYRYEAPETVGTAGQLIEGGTRLEGIALPPTYKVSQAHVDVQISPSLAAVTVDSLDYLRSFPYDCTEQTVSKFLPNAVTLLAFRQFNLADATLEGNLQINVNAGLQKLYAQQHFDGGWGWFVQSKSDAMVSAYVLHGLLAAQEAGVTVDQQVLQNGLDYVRGELVTLNTLSAQYALHRQAYILWVLAKAGAPDVSRTVQLFEGRQGMQHWARALLAQTLWMIDKTDPRLEDLKSDLVNAAILSATGTHWEEESDDVWNWNTDTRSTAIILDTFAKLWPDNDLAPNATRWLMIARSGSHWETTQETVWGIIGLTDWMVATGELTPNYDWQFSLNGQEWASGKASLENVRQSTKITIDLADLLTQTVNRLSFGRSSGDGRMYYTAHLTAYLPVEEIQPLSRGVIVNRQYLDAAGKPVTEARDGDTVTVRLSIIAPNDLYYVVVEDFYPAGAEAVDTNLLTESVTGERPTLRPDDPLSEGWGWWWFSKTDLRDEKAVLFADYLPRGTYEYVYQIRLGSVGKFHVIPPVAREFYMPEVYGRGAGSQFTVLPKQ